LLSLNCSGAPVPPTFRLWQIVIPDIDSLHCTFTEVYQHVSPLVIARVKFHNFDFDYSINTKPQRSGWFTLFQQLRLPWLQQSSVPFQTPTITSFT
jgi:hypothetical protein